MTLKARSSAVIALLRASSTIGTIFFGYPVRHIALSFQVAITLQVYVTFAVSVRSGKRDRESTATGRAFYYTGEPVRTYTGWLGILRAVIG